MALPQQRWSRKRAFTFSRQHNVQKRHERVPGENAGHEERRSSPIKTSSAEPVRDT
jgi:hypothetical protein